MYSFLHHPNLSKTENVVLQVILLTLRLCYKLNRCYIKLSLVNILENVFVFIEILFKMLLFEGSVLIYAEHCIYIFIHSFIHAGDEKLYTNPYACIWIIAISLHIKFEPLKQCSRYTSEQHTV